LEDYIDRMADATMKIAGFEGADPSDLVKVIIGHFADHVRIRVIHPDVSGGSIPSKTECCSTSET